MTRVFARSFAKVERLVLMYMATADGLDDRGPDPEAMNEGKPPRHHEHLLPPPKRKIR